MNPKRKTIKHYEIEGHAHYLTFSCYRQLPLLSKDRTCQWLIDSIEAARTKHSFDLWAWVIMPNHAHLLIRPRLPNYCMGSMLRSIKQPGALEIHENCRATEVTVLSLLRACSHPMQLPETF